MEFLQNTNNWVKGEILEASIIAVFGIIVLLSGVALGKFGTTPNARALLLPLLVVGILLLSFGISLYFSNQKRLSEYKEQFEENTIEFVQQEKKRVEDFQYMYIISKVIATIAFVLAFFAFWFTKSSNIQGIAIGLLLFGISSLVIDFFSEERAKIYYNKIKIEQSNKNQ